MCPEWSARGFISMEVTPSMATCLHGRQMPQQQYRHMQEKTLTHWKRPWCWERLKARGEGDDRGSDGWMASPSQWIWVWVSLGSWWWIGRPGVLQSMGSQRVGCDWVIELNCSNTSRPFRYDLNQIFYDYTVEMTNKFKGLHWIECLENYGWRFITLYKRQWLKQSPRKSKNAKWLPEEALKIAE